MSRLELLYGLAAAAANLLGATAVVRRRQWSIGVLDAVVALAAGYILSVAIVDLVPASVRTPTGPVVVLGAYLLVHLTQHTLGRHFHFGEETHEVSAMVSVSALIGLLMHTFADGVAVASGLRVSDALGVLVFLGVVLHKVPEGLAISSLFLAAGASRRRALAAAGALGVATFAGVVLTERFSFLRTHGLAIAAGVTLYVGASNLVPEFQAKHGWSVPASFLAGCGLYFVVRALAFGAL